jgi:glyoxylase-like metal-dependent hydrolase (beta-lactamase superfamily II)
MKPTKPLLVLISILIFVCGALKAEETAYNFDVEVFKGDVASVNSYIFSNGKSLIVMDAQGATSEAKKLAEVIKLKNLPLTHILISHGHSDHYIGMDWLHKEFPEAKIVVATADIKKDIKGDSSWMESEGWFDEEPNLKPKSAINPNGFDYDSNIHILTSNKLSLSGGGTLELKANYKPSESEHPTTVYSKDLNALFISDFGYNDVHLWMGTGVTAQHIANWKSELEVFKSQYAKLNPQVFPGHGNPADIKLFDVIIQYIDDFNRITSVAKSKEEAMKKMITLYPDYKEADFLLKYSVDNHVK